MQLFASSDNPFCIPKMAKYILLICLLFIGVFQVAAHGDEGEQQSIDYIAELSKLSAAPDHQRDYEKINKYLEDNVKQNGDDLDVESNLEAGSKFLQAKKAWNPNLPIVEALEQFTSLNGVETRCDWAGFVVLFKNIRATKLDDGDWAKFNRVDNLVLKLVIQHSNNCYRVYPARWRSKLASLGEGVVKRVDIFTEAFLMRYSNWRSLLSTRSKIKLLLDKFVLKTESIDEKRDGRIAYEAIKNLAKDDPDLRYLEYVVDEENQTVGLSEDKIRLLFDTYLLEPCKRYTQELGPDVFVPANFDAIYKLNFDVKEVEYHESWARYRICSVLIEHDYDAIFKQFMSVLKQALGEPPAYSTTETPAIVQDQPQSE